MEVTLYLRLFGKMLFPRLHASGGNSAVYYTVRSGDTLGSTQVEVTLTKLSVERRWQARLHASGGNSVLFHPMMLNKLLGSTQVEVTLLIMVYG